MSPAPYLSECAASVSDLGLQVGELAAGEEDGNHVLAEISVLLRAGLGRRRRRRCLSRAAATARSLSLVRRQQLTKHLDTGESAARQTHQPPALYRDRHGLPNTWARGNQQPVRLTNLPHCTETDTAYQTPGHGGISSPSDSPTSRTVQRQTRLTKHLGTGESAARQTHQPPALYRDRHGLPNTWTRGNQQPVRLTNLPHCTETDTAYQTPGHGGISSPSDSPTSRTVHR